MSLSRSLTTGEAARVCQVSQATILNWIRVRGLSAHTTAGGHYRVRPTDLQDFAVRYGMQLDWDQSHERMEQSQ